MTNIKSLILELKYEMFKNILLTAFLKSVIAFFIFDIIASFLDLWYAFSYVFAGAYFIRMLAKKMGKIHLRTFEEHNPEIKEMLTTAADNADKDNIVVIELFKEVIEKVRKISSGTLVVPQALLIMILAIPVLAVVDFEVTPYKIDALSQETMLNELGRLRFMEGLFNRTKADGNISEDEFLEEDIYGERRIAELGDQEINVKMSNVNNIDFTRPKDSYEQDTNFKDYPDEENSVIVFDDKNDIEDFKDEKDLVLKYNEKIRELEQG